jgi:transposase-like protein
MFVLRADGSICIEPSTQPDQRSTFFLSALRSADAAKALFGKALADASHPQPWVINTDKAKCYPRAVSES